MIPNEFWLHLEIPIDITDRDRIYKELVVIRVVVEGGKDER